MEIAKLSPLKVDTWSKDLNADFTCLFGAIKLTTYPDTGKFSCSGYDIGLDSHSLFSVPEFDWGKNAFTPIKRRFLSSL